MTTYWIYILFSEKFKRFYIGQTDNLESRLMRHNKGIEKSTKAFRPWVIVCALEKPSRSEAMLLEKKLKNLNSEDLRKFIKNIHEWVAR